MVVCHSRGEEIKNVRTTPEIVIRDRDVIPIHYQLGLAVDHVNLKTDPTYR